MVTALLHPHVVRPTCHMWLLSVSIKRHSSRKCTPKWDRPAEGVVLQSRAHCVLSTYFIITKSHCNKNWHGGHYSICNHRTEYLFLHFISKNAKTRQSQINESFFVWRKQVLGNVSHEQLKSQKHKGYLMHHPSSFPKKQMHICYFCSHNIWLTGISWSPAVS